MTSPEESLIETMDDMAGVADDWPGTWAQVALLFLALWLLFVLWASLVALPGSPLVVVP